MSGTRTFARSYRGIALRMLIGVGVGLGLLALSGVRPAAEPWYSLENFLAFIAGLGFLIASPIVGLWRALYRGRLTASAEGLAIPGRGHLAWRDVAEIWVERPFADAENPRLRRLGERLIIVPTDPTFAKRSIGGRFARATGLVPNVRDIRPDDAHPHDLAAHQAIILRATDFEEPFETVVAAIERHRPVTELESTPRTS